MDSDQHVEYLLNDQPLCNDLVAKRSGRESLRGLARKPLVRLLLVVTAVGQVIAVAATVRGDETSAAATEAQRIAAVVPDTVTVGPNAVQAAWMRKAIEREAAKLGDEYRMKGYAVSPQLAMQIGEAAAEFEIEPEIAFGLVRAESSFRNTATSTVGAVGLTQLMPRTASWMEPGVTRTELRDPETNLRIGFKYLRYLLDKYEGNERLALLAYNRGPGTVDRELKRGGDPDNGYADFVHGEENHGHTLFTR